MSKYGGLWEYIRQRGETSLTLTFEEIAEKGAVEMDHSFLTCKKELAEYGYAVKKISMKNRTVLFIKTDTDCGR